MLTLTVYGGVAGDELTGEIGGNKILLEWSDKAYLLDFGQRFSVSAKFFEEFLKPRTAVGLRDYLRMGLLPPLEGLYREDLSAHEPGLWERYNEHPHHRRLDHVDGVLLSHGHVDHSGALGFLRSDIPVYTGLMTAIMG
ncbi:MAG: MBL fold metallo-hydrolase, partial [Gemmatimonadales bacterium]